MLTQKELKRQIQYNPKTGIFVRLISNIHAVKVGDIAGHKNSRGYIVIRINNKRYYAHRLAFLYMTGKMPKNYIDYEDRNKSNNRWNNLREATNKQNQANSKLSSRNTSGYKGIRFIKNCKNRPWLASRTKDNKSYCIGYFATLNEAIKAYDNELLKDVGKYYKRK